jgi:hypothetical protein
MKKLIVLLLVNFVAIVGVFAQSNKKTNNKDAQVLVINKNDTLFVPKTNSNNQQPLMLNSNNDTIYTIIAKNDNTSKKLNSEFTQEIATDINDLSTKIKQYKQKGYFVERMFEAFDGKYHIVFRKKGK